MLLQQEYRLESCFENFTVAFYCKDYYGKQLGEERIRLAYTSMQQSSMGRKESGQKLKAVSWREAGTEAETMDGGVLFAASPSRLAQPAFL